MTPWGEKLRDYFRGPFPGWFGSKRGTFSAYKMPGLIVHIPVVLASVALFHLFPSSGPLAWTGRGLLVVSGIYWGRDLAILCHYFILLVPVVIGGIALGLPPLMAFPHPPPVEVSCGILGIIVLIWVLILRAHVRSG